MTTLENCKFHWGNDMIGENSCLGKIMDWKNEKKTLEKAQFWIYNK